MAPGIRPQKVPSNGEVTIQGDGHLASLSTFWLAAGRPQPRGRSFLQGLSGGLCNWQWRICQIWRACRGSFASSACGLPDGTADFSRARCSRPNPYGWVSFLESSDGRRRSGSANVQTVIAGGFPGHRPSHRVPSVTHTSSQPDTDMFIYKSDFWASSGILFWMVVSLAHHKCEQSNNQQDLYKMHSKTMDSYLNDQYTFASVVKERLYNYGRINSSQRKYKSLDLRILVGHANLLDRIMDDIDYCNQLASDQQMHNNAVVESSLSDCSLPIEIGFEEDEDKISISDDEYSYDSLSSTSESDDYDDYDDDADNYYEGNAVYYANLGMTKNDIILNPRAKNLDGSITDFTIQLSKVKSNSKNYEYGPVDTYNADCKQDVIENNINLSLPIFQKQIRTVPV